MKGDIILSEALIPISIVSGGLSLFATLAISALLFPTIIASALLFGFSCLGPSRAKQYKR